MGTSVTTGISERLVPDFKLKVNGSPLEADLVAALRLVEVQQSVRLIDQAVLDFENHGGHVSDAAVFKPGNEVEVEVGYVGEIVWAFKGEIVSVEPHFPVGGNPTVIVRAYDKLHRYRRGRKTRTFLNQKVSDVVTTLASEEGLTPEVEDTQTQHDWLLQNNQTNIDLIHELSRKHGYEVEVTEGSKLFFKKPRHSETTANLTLTWGQNLKSFYVRKSLANVKTEVEARYWNMKEKTTVSETSSDLHGTLSCETAVPTEAKDAFGDGKLVVTLRPNTSPAEAQALAWSLFNEAALDAVRGRGTCLGEPNLAPSQILELIGLGKTWSGLYYVTKATHVLHRVAGYSTEFEVRRTGSGNVQAPDPVEFEPPPTEEREPWSRMGATVSRGGVGLVPVDVQKKEEPEDEVPTHQVKLRFADEDDEPFANCPYELEVGDQTYEGETTDEGRVECEVTSEETTGEITIWIDRDKDGESYTWPISISG
jgi:phage protein D